MKSRSEKPATGQAGLLPVWWPIALLAALLLLLVIASRQGWGLFYGLGGPVAIALLLFALHRVSRRQRWNVLGTVALMVGLVLLFLIAWGYVWLLWNFEIVF
jgi:hypothetical protein